MIYKELLLQVAKDWATDKAETDADTDATHPRTSTQTPRVPEDPPGRLSGDMWKRVLQKIVGSERGERKYPARRCHVCAAHKQRSETRYICKFCLVPLHKGECFQRYFLKISVHRNSQRIYYKFLKKHSIKVELHCLNPGNVHLNDLKAPVLNVLTYTLHSFQQIHKNITYIYVK